MCSSDLNPALKTAWQDMASGKDGDIAVQIYRQVREFYERRMNEYVQVQLRRIAEYGKVKGLSDEEIELAKRIRSAGQLNYSTFSFSDIGTLNKLQSKAIIKRKKVDDVNTVSIRRNLPPLPF